MPGDKPTPKKVAIVGAKGYSGRELVKLCSNHPVIEQVTCVTREGKWDPKQEFLPAAPEKITTLSSENLLATYDQFDVIFLATPAETSINFVKKLRSFSGHIIDLSGGFRISAEDFQKYYGLKHEAQSELMEAAYGLVPWENPENLKKAKLIANPGCYPTATLMALIPVLKNSLIESENIVIDGKSGFTGAGRKASEKLLFSEVYGDLYPYKVGKHQHLPEIKKYGTQFGEKTFDPFFSTTVIPIPRGLSISIFAKAAKGTSPEMIQDAFTSSYQNYPMVKVEPFGKSFLHNLKKVVGSCRTHISFHQEGDKVFLFSCIDNLLKGAASQAIENFNLLFDFPAPYSIKNEEGVL